MAWGDKSAEKAGVRSGAADRQGNGRLPKTVQATHDFSSFFMELTILPIAVPVMVLTYSQGRPQHNPKMPVLSQEPT